MRLEHRPRTPAGARASRRRRILSSTVVLALLALPVFLPGGASADEITDKRAQAQQISAKLDALNQRLSELDEQYNDANIALDKAEADVADAQSRLDATNAELDQRTTELRSFAVQAYMTGNDTPEFEAILTSSAEQATQKKSYLEAASGSRQDLLDELNGTKQKVSEQASKLAAAQAGAQAQRDTLRKSKDQADAAVGEQQQIQSQVQGELATLVAEEQQRQADAQMAQARAAAATAAAQQAAARPAAPRVSVAPPSGGPSTPPPTTGGGGGGGSPSSGAAAAIAAARSALGKPYVWAAAGPNAFDCSGLVMWAWKAGGRSLPHSSAAMYSSTRRIPMSDLQPGDLVFYGSPVHHVALYIGGGQIIHAPHAGSYVQVASVNYWSDIAGAGRV